MIIYLIGFMGCGKTVVGKELRRLLSYPLIDTDEEIIRREGRKISEIFAEDGEETFRDIETSVLKDLSSRKLLIVSCGGGIVLREENRRLMKDTGFPVLLTATPENVEKRLLSDSSRPLLQDKKTAAEIARMMEKRRAAYEAAAAVTFSTDETEPAVTAQRIVNSLPGR